MNKKAQVFDTEVLLSPMFFILLLLGLGIFAIQLIIWKKMEFQMKWWVKITVILLIPVAAYLWAYFKQ